MYTLTSKVHEFETTHHVYFLKPSVSDPHTIKCTWCMCTYIVMNVLYSHLFACMRVIGKDSVGRKVHGRVGGERVL